MKNLKDEVYEIETPLGAVLLLLLLLLFFFLPFSFSINRVDAVFKPVDLFYFLGGGIIQG